MLENKQIFSDTTNMNMTITWTSARESLEQGIATLPIHESIVQTIYCVRPFESSVP